MINHPTTTMPTMTHHDVVLTIDGKPLPLSPVPAHYLQMVGRALRGRLVHAQRARKLRRRGEIVRFAGYTSTGQIKYRWMKQTATIIDFKHDPANAGQNEAQLAAYNWVLDESHHQKLGG